MDAATFRTDFPQFADVAAFPTASINFWLGLGQKLYSDTVFGPDLYPYILELFVAHNLSVVGKTVGGVAGGPTGSYTGLVSSKSVGGVSVSYDTNAGITAGAGTLGLSLYGNTLYQYILRFGAGGIQL